MVQPMGETRAELLAHVRKFREKGIEAEPVIFGHYGKREAALLPFETFELLMDIAEDAFLQERVKSRLASDEGNRTSLGQVADEFGVDLESL